jgi:hypothetical protein
MYNPINNIEGDWKTALAGDGERSAVCIMSKFSPILSIAIGLSIFYPDFAVSQVTNSAKETVRQGVPSQASAQIPNIQGEWKMSIIGENLSSTYSLIQKGTVLTGTFRAPLGTFPITGTITKDRKINFSAKAGGGMNLKFAGTVDGKTMKGVADIPMKGQRNWTATQ